MNPDDKKKKVVLGEEDFGPVDKKRGPAWQNPEHDGDDLTKEAKEMLQRTSADSQPVFDEDKDRLLAQEQTRHLPVDKLKESQAAKEAQRLVEAGDDKARMAEDQKAQAQQEVEDDVIIDRGPAEQDDSWRASQGISEKERRQKTMKNRAIGFGIFALISALLIIFAPAIQEMIFKTRDNSLIFSPAKGFFGPRGGMIEILVGLFGLGLWIFTIFSKKQSNRLSKKVEANRNPLKNIALALAILLPIGFASLFNFTEFRNDDIRFSSLFNRNKKLAYEKVESQVVESSGKDFLYTIKSKGVPDSVINISKLDPKIVKTLDAKLPSTRNVTIDANVLDAIVKSGLYTRDEAIGIYIDRK